MAYPNEWKVIEDAYDRENINHGQKTIQPSLKSFCLSDFLIIQKWIDYARGIGDPSCGIFENDNIIYNEIYNLAKVRKLRPQV